MAAPTGGDFREAENAVRCQAVPAVGESIWYRPLPNPLYASGRRLIHPIADFNGLRDCVTERGETRCGCGAYDLIWDQDGYGEWLTAQIAGLRRENARPKPGAFVKWTPPSRLSRWRCFLGWLDSVTLPCGEAAGRSPAEAAPR